MIRLAQFQFLMILFVLMSTITACKEPNRDNGSGSIKRSSDNTLDTQTRESVQITRSASELAVQIGIPRAHHAYLDRGKEGNLIPISFNWKKLLKDGSLAAKPRLFKKPDGQFDKVVEATVLRGSGTFVFSSGSKPWPSGKSFRILTQICNETTGQCYPPSYRTVKIP